VTSIEWVKNADGSQGRTWNPIRGCTRVSPGCGGPGPHGGCYAEVIAARFSGPGLPYHGIAEMRGGKARWTGKLAFIEEKLTEPLKVRKPTTWFVNSMSDLFHEGVPDEWIDRVFAVMALCPQHTFQVLTKRPARMREWFEERWQPTPAQRIEFPGLPAFDAPAQAEGDDRHERVYQAAGEFLDLDTVSDRFWNPDGSRKWPGWPLPNVWLGVSAEDQRRADERVPDLLATPAAVRFVSAEPLLGPIDFSNMELSGDYVLDALSPASAKDIWNDCWSPEATGMPLDECIRDFEEEGHSYPPSETKRPGLDWIIVGGESGPGARPMHPDWARQIRDACAAAGVAYLFKQWGAFQHGSTMGRATSLDRIVFNDGRILTDVTMPACKAEDRENGWKGRAPEMMALVGKKAAGRLLDGVEHNGFPAAAHPAGA
jgi:protein gp37